MKDKDKTQGKLIKELAQLRRRIAELEAAGHKRNQFEDALRTERDKAQHYLDIAEVILIALNKKGEITLINRKGNQILGYKEGELLSKNWFTTCVPSPRRKKLKSRFLKLMAGKIKLTEFYEDPALTKAGTERIIAWHNSLLKDAQGNHIGTLSSGADITERKQAEDKIRESKQLLEKTFASLKDAFLIIDARTTAILDCNPATSEIFGYDRDELIGKTVKILHVDKKTNDEFRSHLHAAIEKQGFLSRFEFKMKRKDGMIFPTEHSVMPLEDAQGNRTRWVSMVRDITERKRAEKALQESETTLRALINAPTDSILLLDSQGIILDLNEFAAERLGKSRNELIGTLADYSLPENAVKRRRSIISQIVKTGREVRFEDERDGIWSDTVAHPITDKDGTVGRIAIIARDISERKQAEAQRERNLRETRVRYEVSQALVGKETEDEVLDVLIQRAGLYPQAHATIFTFDRSGGELALILRRDSPSESGVATLVPIGARIPASHYPVLNSFSTDQPFVADDVCADERVDPTSREMTRQSGAASLAAFHLAVGNERMGYIIVLAKPTNYFDEEKRHLYQTLAEQGAAALRAARLREQIRESQQRFQGLVETLSDWIWEVDGNGIYTYISPTVRELLGYKPEEVLGKTPFDFMPPEEAERVKGIFASLVTAQQPLVTLENTCRHKDGRLVVFETSGVPFFNAEGQFMGYRGIDRDITERKQTEVALKERQETINAIIETSQDWIWAIDRRGVHTYSNPAIEKILGYRPEEIVGSLSFDLVHEGDKKMVETILQECEEKKCGWNNLLLRWRHKNDTYRYLESNSVPILNSTGDVVGFRGVDRDITERKRAEEELRQKSQQLSWLNDQLEFVLGATKTGIDIIDADFNLIYIDRQWQQAYGDPTGRKCYEYYMGREQPCPTCGIPKALETKQTIVAEEVLPRENNRIIEVHTIPFQEPDGRWRVAEFNLDITERKQAEAALRESEERYRRLVDNSLLGIGISCGDQIVFANPALLRLFGYDDFEEFAKIPLLNSIAPVSREFIADRMKKIAQGEQLPTEFEFALLRKDGLIKTVQASSQHFTLDGKIYTQTTFQDITERKRADSLIQIRLRLTEFAASHSLKELLQKTLDEVCEFTGSFVGFYHFVNEDQKTLSLQAWSTRTVGEFCKAAGAGMHYSIDKAGVWVDCIRERRPVIHNDYVSLPHRKGMPEGHAAIVRELVVPIMRSDRFVAVLGIGNKPQDYTDQDVQAVSYLADVAWEIAERKRTGEAFEESEKKYRQVVENATDIIYTTDINGNFTYANSIALKVTGYSLEELQRFNYLNLVVPEYRDQLKEIYGNQFRSRQATTYVEFPFSNKFGEVMWFGQNASLMIEGGKIIGFQVIARDISERKRVEKALGESEEKYRDLVENINDIIYATDESGTVTYISPTIESISGYTVSDIIGKPFFKFVYKNDISSMKENFRQDIVGQAEPHEYRMITKSGDVRWVRTSSRPFFEGDRVAGLRGVLTDITERKQAEEEIKRSYEQLQETLYATVNALAATVEMKDQYTAGHQPRVTKLACAIAEEMGLTPEQIEGIRMAASIHDIGKIMVPAEILNKPGPLTEIQYEMIKMHSRAGYDILKGLKLPWPVAQIILQHHERMDGSGYPQGLSGEKIMVEARILAVANVVEAMNAHRPYRPAYDIKEALAEISKNRGTFYDPAVVDACLRLFTQKGFILDSLPR